MTKQATCIGQRRCDFHSAMPLFPMPVTTAARGRQDVPTACANDGPVQWSMPRRRHPPARQALRGLSKESVSVGSQGTRKLMRCGVPRTTKRSKCDDSNTAPVPHFICDCPSPFQRPSAARASTSRNKIRPCRVGSPQVAEVPKKLDVGPVGC